MTGIAITPWKTRVPDGDRRNPAGEVELRDLARALVGALFVSLPLLFTQEMWEVALEIPLPLLIGFLALSVGINRLYLDFSGFRRGGRERAKWWDAIVAMGVGMVAAVITLLLFGIISPDIPLANAARIVALETVPMSMGAAVAANQLGDGDAGRRDGMPFGLDMQVVLGALLGGFLFAFNIAPTEETKLVAERQDWWLAIATVAVSLAISYLTVAIAQVEEDDLAERKVIDSEWLEALVAYLAAFVLSVLMLWVFGFGRPFGPVEMWLPQAVALAYATTLGGAAGRLIL